MINFLCYLAKKYVLSLGEHNRTAVLVALELGERGWKTGQWLPSLPDLYPCDFFLWGIVEREVNGTFHPNTSDLEDAITSSMANLDRDTVSKACKSFRGRLESVVAKEGRLSKKVPSISINNMSLSIKNDKELECLLFRDSSHVHLHC